MPLLILLPENHEALGAIIRLVSSCSGQVLLAHMDVDDCDSLLRSLPKPWGISRAKLEKALEKIRRRGFEIHPSPMTAGVTDMSYPIRGFDGKVVAALTIPYLHALDNSLPTTVEQTRRLLEQAARRISQSLGWT